jgi:hypothetical protein
MKISGVLKGQYHETIRVQLTNTRKTKFNSTNQLIIWSIDQMEVIREKHSFQSREQKEHLLLREQQSYDKEHSIDGYTCIWPHMDLYTYTLIYTNMYIHLFSKILSIRHKNYDTLKFLIRINIC